MYFSHYQQRQFLADGSGCGHFLRMHEGGIRQTSRSAGTDDGFESEIRSGGKRTFHKSGDCVFIGKCWLPYNEFYCVFVGYHFNYCTGKTCRFRI